MNNFVVRENSITNTNVETRIIDSTSIATVSEKVLSDVMNFYYSDDLFLNKSYEDERSIWNSSLIEISSYSQNNNSFSSLAQRFESALEFIQESAKNNNIDSDIINDARNAYINYISDNENNRFNEFSTPSIDSLLQLVRFMPEMRKLQHSVYIDEVSGSFGLTLKSSKKSKPILNLLMKSNREVIFSFIKKGKGIVKITGRAYFNDNLEDSHEIYNLVRMVKR